MYRVLFHVDELNKAALTLNNIKNLVADLGEENLIIEVVANSEGIKMFLKEAVQFEDLLKELSSKKVIFSACSNAMKSFGYTRDSLFNFINIVPSGVGELVKKQAEGYAYIKP